MIFQGGVYVDVRFTTSGRNENTMNELDMKRKADIENILNDEFCSLDEKAQVQGNICMIQSLEFKVKRGLVVEYFQILPFNIPLNFISK